MLKHVPTLRFRSHFGSRLVVLNLVLASSVRTVGRLGLQAAMASEFWPSFTALHRRLDAEHNEAMSLADAVDELSGLFLRAMLHLGAVLRGTAPDFLAGNGICFDGAVSGVMSEEHFLDFISICVNYSSIDYHRGDDEAMSILRNAVNVKRVVRTALRLAYFRSTMAPLAVEDKRAVVRVIQFICTVLDQALASFKEGEYWFWARIRAKVFGIRESELDADLHWSSFGHDHVEKVARHTLHAARMFAWAPPVPLHSDSDEVLSNGWLSEQSLSESDSLSEPDLAAGADIPDDDMDGGVWGGTSDESTTAGRGPSPEEGASESFDEWQ